MGIIYFGLFLCIVAFVAFLNTPKEKGIVGEFKVRIKIGKTKENIKYVLNDVLIDTETKSSQIDHIVINKYGVYVIETKNYSGRIYGNDSQLEWTQVLKYGKVKNKLYNPVKQNNTHIYELKKIISEDIPIKSIIVFVKGNIKYIDSKYVYGINQIKKIINTPITNDRLDINKMIEINNNISNKAQESKTTSKEHIENIHKMKNDINNNICPRCGGKLIEKNSKYGKFIACSNYPSCTFKKKK